MCSISSNTQSTQPRHAQSLVYKQGKRQIIKKLDKLWWWTSVRKKLMETWVRMHTHTRARDRVILKLKCYRLNYISSECGQVTGICEKVMNHHLNIQKLTATCYDIKCRNQVGINAVERSQVQNWPKNWTPSFTFLWFSSDAQARYSDSTPNYATTTSFHILSNSLFTNHLTYCSVPYDLQYWYGH